MQFTVEVHTSPQSGKVPAEEALADIDSVSPDLRNAMLGAIRRIEDKSSHGGALTEYIEPDLWCIRVRYDGNIARMFFTFRKGKRIILLNGFVKKDEKIPIRYKVKARKLLKEVTI